MARNVLDGKKLMPGFDFGSNWLAYSQNRLDVDRLRIAEQSLLELMGRESFRGASFLDVGCGSGLFSLAAHRLQARRVVGIDINPNSIKSSLKNRDRFAPESPICFRQASVLSSDDLEQLGFFDVVYAWGVLHHTGAMWQAIRNAARLVVPNGVLIVSIYTRHFTSSIWKAIKWLYNELPPIMQKSMVAVFAVLIYIAKFIVTRRNPLQKERGMDFWYDVVDWVGGYPYEYAFPEEVIAFLADQGFTLRNYIPAKVPTGCNEFIFLKTNQ